MSYFRTKTIYLSVSLMIMLPIFLLILYSASSHRDQEIHERNIRTSYIASQAEQMLEEASDLSLFADMIDDLARIIPTFDIGFYSLADERITIYQGNQPSEKIQSWMTEAINSVPVGQSLEHISREDILIARQVEIGQVPIGYFFARYNVDDISGKFSLELLLSSIVLIMVTTLVLLMIRALATRFNHSLEILSDQIQVDEESRDVLQIYPDIQPIIERINRKNNDLRNMAQKYVNEAYKMKQLMDMAPLGILSIDERGTITACNTAYSQLYPAFDRDRLIGMNIRVLSEHSLIPDIERRIELALSGIVTDANTLEYDQKVMLIYAYPIYDENHTITGALGLYQDITEIERLRNELHRIDRLHVIGQMAASFAHEVRNPLTVIRGFMQLMQRKMDPEKIHDYLEMVISELDRSNEIIGNFLSLAQNRFLQKDKVNLNRIITEIETLLYAEANRSNIELHIDKDPALHDLLLNDKEIKQLILNLTRNGIESMSSGGKLYIRTIQHKDATVLEVQDTGHGIPKDKLDQLFEPFYTTKPSGTGLGLAVCHSIVERHHAEITVRSQESIGTTFSIRFEVAEETSRNAG